jgi:hypothetical protein
LVQAVAAYQLGNTSFVYRMDQDDVLILRVVHGRRDLQPLFEDFEPED